MVVVAVVDVAVVVVMVDFSEGARSKRSGIGLMRGQAESSVWHVGMSEWAESRVQQASR